MILAKPDETLVEHIENSLSVFRDLKRTYSEISMYINEPKFFEYLFYTIFLHDFGKAAFGFQEILSEKNKGKRWNYRHEILSAGFVGYLNYPDTIKKAIALAIITHHKDLDVIKLKFATIPEHLQGKQNFLEKSNELKENIINLKTIMKKYIPKFSKKYLGYKLKNYNLPEVADLGDPRIKDKFLDSYFYYVTDFLKLITEVKTLRIKDGIFSGPQLYNFLGIYLRGFLIASDHLSSAGKYSLSFLPSKLPWIKNFKLNEIQLNAHHLRGTSLLIAPTGYGKTEAALLWALNNQNQTKSKRIFYLLPYIASINAMYNRLEMGFNYDDLIGILHGKTSTFLYDLYKKDKSEDMEVYSEIVAEVRKKKNICRKIYLPLKVMTPFQLLKSFFQIKGFEQQLTELTGSLIIVDEIHAYDVRSTSLILGMLQILNEYFHTKIFIMSATIPSFLAQLIQDKLKLEENNFIKVDDIDLEKIVRHEVKLLNGTIYENLEFIKSCMKKYKKMLVVCNTVKTAQDIFGELKKYSQNPILIHSRFTPKDRNEKENQLNDCDLLVGTQAIEVSLDINFDILFSEIAPFDAIIQRAGRINRTGHLMRDQEFIAPIYIIGQGSEHDELIYPSETSIKTLNALKKESKLSEKKIQEILNKVYDTGFSDEEWRLFEDVQNSFFSIIKSIIPFEQNKTAERSFYRLFNSFEVIPLCYLDKVLELINNKQFYELMSLYVSIPDYKYFQLQKSNKIIKFTQTEDIEFVDLPYDIELGLIF